jgi:hypothetical protein
LFADNGAPSWRGLAGLAPKVKFMTELEKLRRDMDALRESIKAQSVSLHQRSPSELNGLLEHAAWCLTELEELQKQLKKLTNLKGSSGDRL